MKTGLPVAETAETLRHVGRLAREHRGQLTWTVVLYACASAAGLGAPWLLGMLIDKVTAGDGGVDSIAFAVAGFVVAQSVFAGLSHFVSGRFGETIMARMREDFVKRALALPLKTVERAGTGDLMTRSSRDVSQLGRVLRYAAPESLVHLVSLVFIMVALVLVSPILAVVALAVTVPVLWGPVRWYLRRARPAYLAESATYSEINEELAATVDGARTIEALRLAHDRISRGDRRIAASYRAERRTLFLRNVLMPSLDFGVTLPVAAVLLTGGLMYGADMISLGMVTAAVLYANQAGEPMFMLLALLDELQTGEASMGRIIGVGPTRDEETAGRSTAPRHGPAVRAERVRYAYTDGHDVLHDVDLTVTRGERLAIVGPSGAGKSTLGRLIAGIDNPGHGSITLNGRAVADLTLDELRDEVLLVTQEHHVFIGTVRDNLALADPSADDARITAALAAVDAADWVAELPDGLDTRVGSGERSLEPSQAQQIALARLVLADPKVLVLDEATSLLDPRAARHLERHLAAVLAGRTVIAIAHRLHTAHDADRIAVVQAGRIAELGPHDDLVAADGHYAHLWRSWQG
ncbi:ABC-type multidrug transport system fused ATPase/permease subunit [Stackebrandtia albiflava]|uniref:ABC-type multidrug transport system fused ATPase/permease subunit n=1 Tax=Stackebrandtia albiflava TaxID=406432 RepID=A0A562UL12_9ACTN|nr:ABC transporter ATP-binding protein [Stackebrandtia albiflava]TWJ06312.1 ABC-type multidrug transport system fused ATPase/permease subunit [Stackebrandtia albiflava]